MNIKRLLSILLVFCLIFASLSLLISCKDDDEDDYDPNKKGDKDGDDDGDGDGDGDTTLESKPGWPEKLLTYEEYRDMHWEEQEAYYNSFETPSHFRDWFNAAKKIYEDSQDREEINGGDHTVDMGE